MHVGFYLLIFNYTSVIGEGTGWERNEFFVFLATTWFINSLVQAFFMPSASELAEMVRTIELITSPVATKAKNGSRDQPLPRPISGVKEKINR